MEISIDNKNEKDDLAQNDLKTIDIDFKDEIKGKPCSSCLPLPKAVYFIIITELCERFAYYGMRSILILYLTQHLLLNEGNSVSIYHFFVGLCYFTTIVGSFFADNYFGKYKTLVFIGSIYTVGCTLMSLTAIPNINLSGPIISLILIGFGTGGVKACVGPFGGDQIPQDNKVALGSYFSMFYAAINFGALLSTIITPIFRANVSCNGSDDCYPLAFGVPAILMGVALVIFLVGRRYYIVMPVRSSIYMKAVGCTVVAIKTWYRERHTNPRKNLLDYARNEYDDEFIKDLRTLSHIAVLYLPLPVYWALYEQMGSRWTLQATLMDGEIAPNLFILPDQMFIFNVLLVVIFIVLFDKCVYPIVYKIIPKLSPLRKMTIGISFTFVAFLAAFILQKQLESLQPPAIEPLYSRLVLVNSHSCDISLSIQDGRVLQASRYQTSVSYLDFLAGTQPIQLSISKCESMPIRVTSINGSFIFHPGQMNFLIVDTDPSNNISIRVLNDSHIPNRKGYPIIRLAVSSNSFNKYRFQLKSTATDTIETQLIVIGNQSLYIGSWQKLSKPGRYVWSVIPPTELGYNSSTTPGDVLIFNDGRPRLGPIKIVSSEVTIYYMTYSDQKKAVVVIPLSIKKGARISILWQLPQYVLISIGEVLVNVPGLIFSYDQAPIGMKSLVNALWYMCEAFGNVIVMIVANINLFEKQSLEYLIFAIVGIVFNIIFAVLAHNYPRTQSSEYVRMT